MTGDREQCVGIGCDDYLTKPIDRAALTALFQKYAAAPSGMIPPLEVATTSPVVGVIAS